MAWLGKKFDDMLRKIQNIRGKMVKNGRKGKFFTVPGKKISFWKKGGGAKISYCWQVYSPAFPLTTLCGGQACFVLHSSSRLQPSSDTSSGLPNSTSWLHVNTILINIIHGSFFKYFNILKLCGGGLK